MNKLLIRHEQTGTGFCSQVQRIRMDGVKVAPAVEIADPLAEPLVGTGLRLGSELTWYLESYLDYPYGPNVQRAERVTQALQSGTFHRYPSVLSSFSRDW